MTLGPSHVSARALKAAYVDTHTNPARREGSVSVLNRPIVRIENEVLVLVSVPKEDVCNHYMQMTLVHWVTGMI